VLPVGRAWLNDDGIKPSEIVMQQVASVMPFLYNYPEGKAQVKEANVA
jgi:hypothetical protein